MHKLFLIGPLKRNSFVISYRSLQMEFDRLEHRGFNFFEFTPRILKSLMVVESNTYQS